MSARVLDGQALARTLQEEIRPDVAAFTAQHGRPPGLGIVLVGDNPASEVYVRGKLKTGTEIGFRTDLERLPATATRLLGCRQKALHSNFFPTTLARHLHHCSAPCVN